MSDKKENNYQIHHGRVLEQIIKTEGLRKGHLAMKLGVHPNTVTNYVQSEYIPTDKLLSIAKALKMDFTKHFPHLQKTPEAIEMMKYKLPDDRSDLPTAVKQMQMENGNLKMEIKFLEDQVETMKELITTKNDLIDAKDAELSRLKSGK